MAQRPLAVPLPHQAAQFLRLRRRITRRDIPHHHHTLHRPYPRRHLLHTPLTPMLRRFNAHDLFASPEQNLDRPSPGEPRYHPRQTRLQVRREQVAITHPPRGVAHYHHLDDAIAQHRGPHHLVRQRLQRPGATIDRHVHVLPYPVPNRLPLAVGFGRRLLRLGQSRPLLRLLAALALLRRRHARVVQRRIAAQPSHEGHPLVQLRQQALGSVSPVADKGKAAIGPPGQHLAEHLPRQVGTTGLPLAGQVQPGRQRQGQDGDACARPADGHGQDNPVVAAGGRHALLRRGHGVAEPAQAPDALAALVGQGVVHQQGDDAEQLEAGEYEDADAVGQVPRCPGGALEEVVGRIQAVGAAVIGGALGVRVLGDTAERVLAEAHDPSEKQLGAGNSRGLCKRGCQCFDEGREGWYHVPHGGTSQSLRTYITLKHRRNPLSLSLRTDPSITGHLFKSLRKLSYQTWFRGREDDSGLYLPVGGQEDRRRVARHLLGVDV